MVARTKTFRWPPLGRAFAAGAALAVLLLWTPACKRSGPPPGLNSSTANLANKDPNVAASGQQRVLRLQLPAGSVPSDGKLLVGWYSQPEIPKVRPGGHPSTAQLVPMLERLAVQPEATFNAGGVLTAAVEFPNEAHQVVAIWAGKGQLWSSLMGNAPAGNFIGLRPLAGDPKGLVTVEMAPIRHRPVTEERCVGPRRRLLTVETPRVAGRVGNRVRRRLCVYLPPSYTKDSRRRYPTVYLLPGLTSTDTAYVTGRRSLATQADVLAKDTGKEMILVGVDTSIRSGSTYLVDSVEAGGWETFLATDVLEAVDGQVRTIAKASARALVGQSTGGFNAMSYGLRYSHLFGLIGSSAPDGLDIQGWLTEPVSGSTPGARRARPLWLALARLESAVGGLGQFISYGAAWSPAQGHPGVDWPFDLVTGAVASEVFDAWVANGPMKMLDSPDIRAGAKERLSGRIYLTVAKGDEFQLFGPAERFSQRLLELDVEHQFVAVSGGHFEGAMERLTACLKFASQRLTTSPH